MTRWAVRANARAWRKSGRSIKRSVRKSAAASRRKSAQREAAARATRYQAYGCTIAHRSQGASDRCKHCQEGRELTAALAAALAVKRAEELRVARAKAAEARAAREARDEARRVANSARAAEAKAVREERRRAYAARAENRKAASAARREATAAKAAEAKAARQEQRQAKAAKDADAVKAKQARTAEENAAHAEAKRARAAEKNATRAALTEAKQARAAEKNAEHGARSEAERVARAARSEAKRTVAADRQAARAAVALRTTGPRLYSRYATAAELAPYKQFDALDFWPEVLAADGTPKARLLQRRFVRRQVQRHGRLRPALTALTLGQAAVILTAYGVDPGGLQHRGRGGLARNILSIPLRLLALFVVIFFSILIGPFMPVLILLTALLWAWASAVRTRRRGWFERGWAAAERRQEGDRGRTGETAPA